MEIAYITWQEEEGIVWQGHGADTDIVIAAGYAFIDMLNGRDVRLQRLKINKQNPLRSIPPNFLKAQL